MTASDPSRQRWSRALDVALVALLLLAVAIKLSGGFVLEILSFELRALSTRGVLLVFAVLWIVRVVRDGTLKSWVRAGLVGFAWLAGAVLVVGLVNGVGVALLNARAEPPETTGGSARSGGLAGSSDWNVLLISLDTLRADHLGCYGYRRDTSPTIDRLAAGGVLFRNQIAAAPDTLVSHASMLTSTNPTVHGAHMYPPQPVHDDAVTLAEVLRAEGFATAAITNGGQLAPVFNLTQGFDLYTSLDEHLRSMRARAGRWWNRSRGQRWFLFFHTYQTHLPYEPHTRFPYGEGYQGRLPTTISETTARRINSGEVEIDDRDREYIVALYDGEISHADFHLNELFERMKADGSWERTLVIVTSDHGEELGEHGKMATHSHTLYDELLKVPFVMRLPGGQFAGVEVDRQTRGIDLAPTILDALGIPIPESMQGVSLLPLVENGSAVVLPPAVSERTAGEALISWRTGDAKLIYPKHQIGGESWLEKLGISSAPDYLTTRHHRELYLLRDDPRELEEMYRQRTWRAKALLRDLTASLERDRRLATPETTTDLDQELRERLEALGYVQ